MFWTERILKGLHLGDQVTVLSGGAEYVEQLDAGLQPGNHRAAGLDGHPIFTASVVTMFQDLDVIGLALDQEQQGNIKLMRGQSVILERSDEAGMWLYAVTVRSKHGIRVETSWPYKSTRVERREFCRVRIEAQTRYALADNATDFRPGILQDISGGGLCLRVTEDVEVGQKLMAEVPFGNEVIAMTGLVRNVHTDELGRKVVGIEFVEIDLTSQDKILSFVFHQQLKMRREKFAQAGPAAIP